MTRYIVLGAGAVGATLAAELHGAGRPAVLVARGDQLVALRAAGLRYLRPDGAHVVDVAVVGGPDELELPADDVLVLATKAQDAEAAVATWSSSTSTRSLRHRRSRCGAAIRCRGSLTSRPPRGAGASATVSRWSSTTTAVGSPPRARGGCCAGPATGSSHPPRATWR